MQVNRIFSHRTHGRIGMVTLGEEKGKWTLDGKELPAASVEYLMTFALQSLQDAYAGADDLAAAQGAFEKKRDAIIAGAIGQRGGGVDEETKIGRQLAEAAFVKKHGKDAWPSEADAAKKKADEILAKNEKAFAPLIAAEIERREAARKAKAEIAAQTGALDL